MCGIAGIISSDHKDHAYIAEMTDLVAHRGRDGCGHFVDHGSVSLGHRRLKIIDLSDDANQPMTILGNVHIVFNGEIYNYLELRDELKAMGYLFGTDSDTEVLLTAYLAWGKDCLHHLNGMFAFIIYDPRRRVVFAARDRFGIKPIYWWETPTGAILVASEIKQFTGHPLWKPVGNKETLTDFLKSGLVDHTDETMFAGVYQLRGGEAVVIPLDDPDISKYKYRWYDLEKEAAWRSATYRTVYEGFALAKSGKGRYDLAVEHFRHLLKSSVHLRMRSDVPVGSCLSGGLDSSSIVCLAAPVAGEGMHTFTLISEDKSVDESEYAQSVVDKTGTVRHLVEVTPQELFERLDELVWHQDEPFQSTSMYGQWKVFAVAKEAGIPVVLDGQGADEILLGYHYVFPIRLKNLLRQGRYRQLLREMLLLRKIPGFKYWSMVQMVWNFYKNRNVPSTSTHKGIPMDFSDLTTYSKTLLRYTSLPALLHWEDRDSMAHTVESRLPFLDYRVVEFLYSLPDDYKLFDAVTKRVLRDAMDGILPDMVRDRKSKFGFFTAETKWFYENVDEFRKRVYLAVLESGGLLGQGDIEKFEKVASGEQGYDFSIWRAIAFGAWKRKFGVEM